MSSLFRLFCVLALCSVTYAGITPGGSGGGGGSSPLVNLKWKWNGDVFSSFTNIAVGGTKPQNYQGDEIFNLPFTFASTSNDYCATVSMGVATSAAKDVTAAIFISGVVPALAAKRVTTSADGYVSDLVVEYCGAVPATGAKTFTVNMGASDVREVVVNGYLSNNALFGGAGSASFKVMEFTR